MSSLVIDLQGFISNEGRFIPKEVAMMGIEEFKLQHWIIKPPYSRTVFNEFAIKSVEWIEKHHHGILWEEGDVSHKDLRTLLIDKTRGYNILFVKGSLKAQYLEEILSRHVVDLESMGCPALKCLDEFKGKCLHEKHSDPSKICALQNVFKLVLWCNDNADKVDLKHENVRLKTFSGFPVPFIHPSLMAEAGFYYCGKSDKVQCAFCPIAIHRWVQRDIPICEHRKFSPGCPFVKKHYGELVTPDVIESPLTGSKSSAKDKVPVWSWSCNFV